MSINPETTQKFCNDLAAANVKLPLSIDKTEQASIVDADGRYVLTVDVNSERPDAEACKIALWIVLAVNTCGGFKADLVSVQ